ncbi:Replication Fork Protection Component Swi3 [Fragilaria crotonensis]|nr:Replication Fork Protection Component Swi3 [Fragilaria crotonensis]
MASLAARRRVTFDAPAQSRNDRLASSNVNRNNYYTSDEDDDEDEEERIAREEEEEELRLSAANGEASEAPSSKKRKQTDQEIADLYASTAKKRKPRATLQPAHLTGADGLIRVRSDFGSLKYPEKRSSLDAAASYSRNLIHAYKGWAYNLFPGLAFEDVLSRVETFGSKREIKSHLTHMRTDVRNAHLERIFGRERAERMINELEDGLKKQQQEHHVDDELPSEAPETPANAAMPSNVLESPAALIQTSSKTHESPLPVNPAEKVSKSRQPAAPSDLPESESEGEFEFEKKPSGAAVTSAFFDTDDEDDANNVDERPTESGAVSPTASSTSPIDGEEFSNRGHDDDENQAEVSPDREVEGGTMEDMTQATVVASQFKTHDDGDGAEEMNVAEVVVLTHVAVFETQFESQTQATLIASQLQSDGNEESQSQTQMTVLASQIGSSEESQSQTQMTVLASQIGSSEESQSQTQMTVLASQIGSSDDSQPELPTQDTVLATQISPTQNVDS